MLALVFGVPIETAIVAALIGFVGALIGQFVGVFLGARYAANLNRRTQLELADMSFQRQWRERLVRPFLDLAFEQCDLLAAFANQVSRGDAEQAEGIANRFHSADSVLRAVSFATFGHQELIEAGDAWLNAEEKAEETLSGTSSSSPTTFEPAARGIQ